MLMLPVLSDLRRDLRGYLAAWVLHERYRGVITDVTSSAMQRPPASRTIPYTADRYPSASGTAPPTPCSGARARSAQRANLLTTDQSDAGST
eukprot:9443964-Pyramimonas_sp.AAC.1